MWTVEYTRKFLKELVALPIEIQSRIEPIVFEALESVDPFELGYLEKMKGYSVTSTKFVLATIELVLR